MRSSRTRAKTIESGGLLWVVQHYLHTVNHNTQNYCISFLWVALSREKKKANDKLLGYHRQPRRTVIRLRLAIARITRVILCELNRTAENKHSQIIWFLFPSLSLPLKSEKSSRHVSFMFTLASSQNDEDNGAHLAMRWKWVSLPRQTFTVLHCNNSCVIFKDQCCCELRQWKWDIIVVDDDIEAAAMAMAFGDFRSGREPEAKRGRRRTHDR